MIIQRPMIVFLVYKSKVEYHISFGIEKIPGSVLSTPIEGMKQLVLYRALYWSRDVIHS